MELCVLLTHVKPQFVLRKMLDMAAARKERRKKRGVKKTREARMAAGRQKKKHEFLVETEKEGKGGGSTQINRT